VSIYSKGNLFKVRVALGKWRKKWEKKNLLKERDLDRETQKVWG
jgi:tmRNA-binding protein